MKKRRIIGAETTHRDLYDILDVEPEASQAQIQRAYRLRARQVHPDKNIGDENAKEAFQQLQHAYNILSDAEKRRQYDDFGTDGEIDEDLLAMVRHRFRKVTVEDICEFERSYKGSMEEQNDLLAFVKKQKGNVTYLLEYMVCSTAGDVGRYLEMLDQLRQDFDLDSDIVAALAKSTPKLKRQATLMSKKAPKEAAAVAKATNAKSCARSSAGGSSLEDLAAAIGANKAGRAQAMIARADSIAASVSTKRLPSRKRPAAAVDEEDAKEL